MKKVVRIYHKGQPYELSGEPATEAGGTGANGANESSESSGANGPSGATGGSGSGGSGLSEDDMATDDDIASLFD